DWSRILDLRLEGTRSRWQVGLIEGGKLIEQTVRDLGPEVAEVLFRWAQRGRISSEGEVKLLGRLLSGALFPQGIRERLYELRQADDVMVRLESSDADLIDMPWEFATVPIIDEDPARGEETFLAAELNYQFNRLARQAREPVEPTGIPRVLGVVVQPSSDRLPMALDQHGKAARWPENVDKLADELTAAVDRTTLRLAQLLRHTEASAV